MHALKQATLSYFNDLKYKIIFHSEEVYEVKQKRTGLEVELDFSVYDKGTLPTECSLNRDKKLVFLNVNDVDIIGFEAIESFSLKLDKHSSLIILDDEFFEQTMKDIWMFLSVDPRDRDAFTDSRFYKA